MDGSENLMGGNMLQAPYRYIHMHVWVYVSICAYIVIYIYMRTNELWILAIEPKFLQWLPVDGIFGRDFDK